MHMEQAQCDQAKWISTINHGLIKKEQSLKIVTTMLIHTRNEHPDMQAKKAQCKETFACPTLNQYNNVRKLH